MRRVLSVVVFSGVLWVGACSVPGLDTLGVSDADDPGVSTVQSDDGFMTYAQMTDEYRQAVATLELPAGVSLPSEPLLFGDEGVFETGSGGVQAIMEWHCAWGREWLDARGKDAERASHALEVYASIVDTDAYRKAFDDVSAKPFVEDIIKRAQLGDPSGVEQDVAANCR